MNIIVGIFLIAVILGSATVVFLLFERFSTFSSQLNIIFSLLVFALLLIITSAYRLAIVREAAKIYKMITSGKTDAEDITK